MEIPQQFQLRDILNHLYIGALFGLVGSLYCWHFFGWQVISILQHGLAGWVLVVLVAYTLGMVFSNIGFNAIESFCHSQLDSGGVRQALGKILGFHPSRTVTTIAFLQNPDPVSMRVDEMMRGLLGIDGDKEPSREWFALAKAIADNCLSATAISNYNRQFVFYNFYGRFWLLSFLSTCTALLAHVHSIWSKGRLSLLALFLILVSSWLSMLIAGSKFQSSRRMYIEKVWRGFLVAALSLKADPGGSAAVQRAAPTDAPSQQ